MDPRSRRRAVQAAFEAGATLDELARQHQTRRANVRAWLARAFGSDRPVGLRAEAAQIVLAARQQGQSLATVLMDIAPPVREWRALMRRAAVEREVATLARQERRVIARFVRRCWHLDEAALRRLAAGQGLEARSGDLSAGPRPQREADAGCGTGRAGAPRRSGDGARGAPSAGPAAEYRSEPAAATPPAEGPPAVEWVD